ncbi:MAG: hypothetical protein HUU02_12030, partial [Bacteroidetes bacterium]|nr:hypothetical protein [Bacteroidota bacterium]
MLRYLNSAKVKLLARTEKKNSRHMDTQMNLYAASRLELLSQLGAIDIAVPPLSSGRTKNHAEQWSICRFLATYNEADFIAFPLRVIHTDKPDYHLSMGTITVGVEITTSTPPQYAQAIAIRNIFYPNGVIEPELFTWDAPKRTESEIIAILKRSSESLHGMGWIGNSVERQWAAGMLKSITAKLKKLNSHGYGNMARYWLIIYDNIPQAALDLNEAMSILVNQLRS